MVIHTNYYYNFGESFARRRVEKFDKILLKKCRSTAGDFGGWRAVPLLQAVPNQYQTPRVKDAGADEQLMVEMNYINADNLNTLFNFTVHMDV